MSGLDDLLGSVVEAMDVAGEAISNLPPSDYTSVDELYSKLASKNTAVFVKMFKSQRAMKTLLEDSKVKVWAGSSAKGKSVDGGTTYPKFYVHTEEAVKIILKAIEAKAKEHSKKSKSSMAALKKSAPYPLDYIQGKLNGARFKVLARRKASELKGKDKTALQDIIDGQERLRALKMKFDSPDLKDAGKRTAYIKSNFDQIIAELKKAKLLDYAGATIEMAVQDGYRTLHWKTP